MRTDGKGLTGIKYFNKIRNDGDVMSKIIINWDKYGVLLQTWIKLRLCWKSLSAFWIDLWIRNLGGWTPNDTKTIYFPEKSGKDCFLYSMNNKEK